MPIPRLRGFWQAPPHGPQLRQWLIKQVWFLLLLHRQSRLRTAKSTWTTIRPGVIGFASPRTPWPWMAYVSPSVVVVVVVDNVVVIVVVVIVVVVVAVGTPPPSISPSVVVVVVVVHVEKFVTKKIMSIQDYFCEHTTLLVYVRCSSNTRIYLARKILHKR
jgi:hypothetical protein